MDLSDDDNENNTSNAIGSFLENIKQKSMANALLKSNRISAYFLPELLPHMMRLCKHFPLWTNILRNVFKSPYKNGSSAAVENDFKELKTQILRFEFQPMTADRFIYKHLTNINNNIKLFKSKQLRHCYPSKKNSSYGHKIKSNDCIFEFEIETNIGNKKSEEVENNYHINENNSDIENIVESDDKYFQVSNVVKQSNFDYCQLTENSEKLKTDDDSDKNLTNIESASDFMSDDNSYSEYNSKKKKNQCQMILSMT